MLLKRMTDDKASLLARNYLAVTKSYLFLSAKYGSLKKWYGDLILSNFTFQ